ncbi:MAG: N-acyl-D-amino-acid deacylase family protein [Hyphomicrobiaceae bacterium]
MDLVIRNGDVIDGTGSPPRRADVAVKGDSIVAVEPDCTAAATRVIDATGLVVAPGFIDAKTHSDFSLPLYPRAESRVHQGVTTELVGSCGFTAAPIPPGRLPVVADYLAAMGPGMTLSESNFADYLDAFPKTSVNVATQVGHNTLRVAVMGLDNRAPTTDEQAAMERLAEAALEAGAFGVSSGPFTAPGAYAKPVELEALATITARRGGTYATHLRDEAENVLGAVDEVIAVAERTGARTRIVHVKLSGTPGWGRAPLLIEKVEAARRRGLSIDCDHYPYTTAVNPVRNLLPAWVQEGGDARFLERLGDASVREAVDKEIAARGLNAFGRIVSWDAVRISTSPNCTDAVGRTVAEIATERQCAPIDVLCAVLAADRGATRALITAMDERDVAAFVACRWVLVGSDGRAVGPGGPLSRDLPHPRFYGTFPRVLGHYARDRGLLTLAEAVHKMTGATAAALGLGDRGILRKGAKADITVFDPKTIADTATFDEPRRTPTGIAHVVVNGVAVIDQGVHTGALPGRILRRVG